jgi:hypothetical protein
MSMDQLVSKEGLLRQVDDLRGQARRARRLAESLTDGEDRTKLLDLARDLDGKADRLEREAADAKDVVLKR